MYVAQALNDALLEEKETLTQEILDMEAELHTLDK